jgi:hypothetical protein
MLGFKFNEISSRQDIFERETLVLFAHELSVIILYILCFDDEQLRSSGNLRLELQSSTTCDVHLERSYLVRRHTTNALSFAINMFLQSLIFQKHSSNG